MSSTTPAIANRLGINRGWINHLTPQNFYLTDMLQITYLKSYLLLREYLKFQQINLLTFDIKTASSYKKVLYLTVYQHLLYEDENPDVVFKLEYLWFDSFAIHQNLNYKKCARASFASKKIIKQNNLLKYVKIQKLPRKFQYRFTRKQVARTSLFLKKLFFSKVRMSVRNLKKNKKILRRAKFSRSRRQKKTRIALWKIGKKRKKKPFQLWAEKWLEKYAYRFKLKKGPLKNKIKKTWLPVVRYLNSILTRKQTNVNVKRLKQNNYMQSLNQLLVRQALTSKLKILKLRSISKWHAKISSFRWKKKSPRQRYVYDNTADENEEDYIYAKSYMDKHIENIMLRDMLTNKTVNVHLKLFFESYLYKWFGLSCIVKFNQTSDSVYIKRIDNNISQKNSELRRIKQFNFFKRLAFMFINTHRNIDAQMVADLIAREVELTREYKHFCHNVDLIFQTFMPRYLKGYRILISGKTKLYELRHSSELITYQGKDLIPRKQFNKRVIYALGVARNKRGVFGIKVWLHY